MAVGSLGLTIEGWRWMGLTSSKSAEALRRHPWSEQRRCLEGADTFLAAGFLLPLDPDVVRPELFRPRAVKLMTSGISVEVPSEIALQHKQCLSKH